MRTSHWSDITAGEVSSMVREAIKRGEQAIVEEANGLAYQNVESFNNPESLK
jgi:small acid-soluble spore protein F (minor alpha/beta-type SASP)